MLNIIIIIIIYLLFPEVVLPCYDLNIINLDFKTVVDGMFSNCSERCLELECSLDLVPRDISVENNTEWRGRDYLASHVLQLQDSEKVSNLLWRWQSQILVFMPHLFWQKIVHFK